MTSTLLAKILEIREKFFIFTGRHERLVMAAVKFVIAFFAFMLINVSVGYMPWLNHGWIALLLALLCAFAPFGIMVFTGAVMIIVHFFGLAQELGVITLLLFLLMFCLYFRFAKRTGIYAILTPLLCFLRIPYVMPVSAGLLGKPYNVISVICGLITFFFAHSVRLNETMFRTFDEDSGVSLYTLAVGQIFADRELILYIAAFAAAAIVVFCVRRMKTDHSWTNAIIIGIVIQAAVISAGEVFLGEPDTILWVFGGCLISLGLSFGIQMMTHSLDYSRVENVQFEDDEYYYYVKAVPKATVEPENVQVKQIVTKGMKPSRSLKRGEKVKNIRIHTRNERRKAKETEMTEQKVSEEYKGDDSQDN